MRVYVYVCAHAYVRVTLTPRCCPLAQHAKKQYCIHFLSQNPVIRNTVVTGGCSAAMHYCTSSRFASPPSEAAKSANPIPSLLVMTFRTIVFISIY